MSAIAKKGKLEAVGDDDHAEPEPGEFVEIPWNGEVFIIPRDRADWSTEGLAWLAEDKYNLFVKYTLDLAKPGQWARVCAMCPRQSDWDPFFKAFADIVNKECVS